MSNVAWAAFFLSLLALVLFLISNYKNLYGNTIQFLLSPDVKIRLETGSKTSEDGEVTVGGPPDEFERKLINLQESHENGPIEISLSQLQHPNDHSEIDHFNISLINGDDRSYKGELTIVADSLISNRHPDVPSEIQDISEFYMQLEKRPAPSGRVLDSVTLGPKIRYEFGEKVLHDDTRSSTSWYINRENLNSESDSITEFEITVEFEPRLTPPNFPWWVPEFVGTIELRPVKNTYVIKDDVNNP